MYSLNLGKLVVATRGRARKGVKASSAKCRYKECHEPLIEGQPNLLLIKEWKGKYTTKRFHSPSTHTCFAKWFEFMVTYLEKRKETNKREGRGPGKPRLKVDFEKVSPEQLLIRRKMIQRRSYLMVRLFNPATAREKHAEIWAEIQELEAKVDAILPSNRYPTKKQNRRYVRFVERGNPQLKKGPVNV